MALISSCTKQKKNVEHFIKLIDGVDLNTHIVFKRNDLGANLAYKISESLGGNHVNKFLSFSRDKDKER